MPAPQPRILRKSLPTWPEVDRRRHRRFRIFYIDVPTFMNRFVLGKTAASQALPATPGGSQDLTDLSDYYELPEVPAKLAVGRKSPLFATGIETIDRQHLQVLAALKQLQTSLASGPASPEVASAVEAVRACAEDHFGFEEAYMVQVRFPDLDRHRQDHDYFRQELARFQKHGAAGETFVVMEICGGLLHWLQDHIFREDRAYALHSRKGA